MTLLSFLLLIFQSAQDDQILERADKILEEAKRSYESAREKNSVESFVDAGFKLEEARIKYFVLQEIGSPEKQKIAVDRLRAINQLSKLIHDGKVAVSGSPAETPAEPATPKPADAPGAEPAPKARPEPARPAVDVSKRAPVPEPARQQEAEKTVKELFKERYAKKSPVDRSALAKALLDQAAKTVDDPVAVWVLCREAQDLSVQNGDVRTAVRAVETAALVFDVDALILKHSVLTAAGKTVKTPAELADLTYALLELIEELIAADQYESADKSAALALQSAKKTNEPALLARATTRTKEVAEAKTRFLTMKSVLQTLARTPEDPGANNEMGQFLCFVKASWDLGLRFLAKGSDATLKGLAEKELQMGAKGTEQAALGDGWWDLAEKEKSPLRKAQMIAHSRMLYEAASGSITGLARAKIEKRLAEIEAATPQAPGTVDLLKLIDPKTDGISGQWRSENGALLCSGTENVIRLQILYQPPDEYDVTMVVARVSNADNISFGLVSGGVQFLVAIDANRGGTSAIATIDGISVATGNPSLAKGPFITGTAPHTVVYSVRKTGVSVTVNGKRILSWEGESRRLGPLAAWKIPDSRALLVGSWKSDLSITKLQLVPVSGQGKKLR